MSRFRTFFKRNKGPRLVLISICVLLYTVLFTYICFTENPLMVARNVNDHMTQQGVDRSSEIVVVAIMPSEETWYGKSAGLLCAETISKMNAEDRPAVIGIEMPDTVITEEAYDLLQEEASKGNLIFPAEITIPRSAVNRSPYKTEVPGFGSVRTYPVEVTQNSRIAHTVQLTGTDGVLRNMTFHIGAMDGRRYPSMAWACYELYCEEKGLEAKMPKGADTGSVIIEFSAEYANFTVTAGDILQGTVDPLVWKDKIVLIGSFDTALDKGYRTAIDHEYRMHSAQVDAEIVNALLGDNTSVAVGAKWQMIVLAVCVFLTVIFITKIKTVVGSVCYCILYILTALIIMMLFFGIGYEWYVFPHLANGFVTGILFTGIAGIYRSRHNRHELERMLGKYVDSRIVGGLLNENNYSMNKLMREAHSGRTAKVAVLFADIRGFTTISEHLEGDQLVRMLNDYLSMMSSCVERYGGTVDKFIGDCVMAYWGAPEADDDPVYHACLAASEIRRRAAIASEKMKEKIGREIEIGIGISYGDAVVGNIGSANRMNFTVIGDTVNVASRLESIAPGGAIYLSGDAAKKLKEVSELEKLPEEVKLKGRETMLSVYALKSISVRGSMNRRKKEEQKGKEVFRRRSYVAAAVNFLIFFFQFVFVINTVRNYGSSFVAYFTIPLVAVSCVVSVLLIPYDLKAAERADGRNIRPHWLEVAMLTALMSNLQAALAVIIWQVPKMGLAAYSSAGWPGGSTIYLICPLLFAVSYFLLEQHAYYRRIDILKAEILPALLLIGCASVAYALQLNRKEAELFEIFYSTRNIILTILLQTLAIFGIVLLNRKLHLQDRLLFNREFPISGHLTKFRHTKLYRFFAVRRNRMLLKVGLNLMIGLIALGVTRKAVLSGGIHAYSNPSLTGIVISISCVLSIAMILLAYFKKEPMSQMRAYKYVSFIRNLGCSVNFFSVLLLAVSGEGISALFASRWSADGWYFVFVPFVSLLMWLAERNEYRLSKLILTPVPFAVLLPLSRAAIIGQGLEKLYAYEIANYYSVSAIVAMVAGEFLLVGLMYLVNLLGCRLFRESERDREESIFSVCGCRYGITAGKKTESEFGLRSECYVLREGNYAIVIGAGSGLSAAPAKLLGCTRVDILLGSSDYRNIMGFLMTPQVCPGAVVRIISPFGAERFSVNPFWPVNLIRKNCITVHSGKAFHLNESYSVLFTAADGTGKNYMIRLTGAVTVCCTGPKPAPEDSVRKWCLGADLLIYNDGENWERGNFIAIDSGVTSLVLSGAPTDMTDEVLSWKEQKSRALYADVHIAREGLTFPISR